VAHSPQAAAVQLYAVINAQTDVVKSQVAASIIHTCISHSHLHQSFTPASVILACMSPALMTCIDGAERPGGKVDTASTYLEHAPVTVADTCAHWQGS